MVRVAVSIDGLREDHDDRRAPATYDRILKNIEGCRVDISWVVTHTQMLPSSRAVESAPSQTASVSLAPYILSGT